MDISKRIDWITCTNHHTEDWGDYLPRVVLNQVGRKLKPLPRYSVAWELRPAGRIDIADNFNQGVMITVTGSEFHKLIANGVSFQHIISELVPNWKFTRLDFAIDIKQSPYSDTPLYREFETMFANGKCETRLSIENEIKNKDKGGYSQYIGSYKSDQFIRIYDKATESGMLLEAMKQHIVCPHWTRVETVTKADFASNLARDMHDIGWEVAGSTKLAKLVDFPLMDEWQKIVGVMALTKLTTTHRKPSAWRKWMDTSVMQSIGKHIKNDEDLEFMIDWLRIVTDMTWNEKFPPTTE